MPSWPGASTLSRSSLTTTVPAMGVNRPVDTSSRAREWLIWAPVSEEPTESLSMIWGSWASSRSLMVGVSGAPPLPTLSRLLVS